MKKNRRGVLLTALALAMGIAMVTTGIAIPTLRPVLSPAPADEDQTLSTAAAGAMANTAEQAIQSPAYIQVILPKDSLATLPPAWKPLATDGTLPNIKVEEHVKLHTPLANDPNEGKPTGALKNWPTTVVPYLLDVLTSYKKDHMAVDSAIDPKMDIIVPGSKGIYKFTLTNGSTVPCDYLFSISETAICSDFPLRFRLSDDAGATGNLTAAIPGNVGGWVNIAQLKPWFFESDVPLPQSGGTRTFTLDWEWVFHTSDTQDNKDSTLGRLVRHGQAGNAPEYTLDSSLVPQYQLKLDLRVKADSPRVMITFDPQESVVGGTVSGFPMVIPYDLWQLYKEGGIPVPTKDGYKFLGWATDKEGKHMIDLDSDQILEHFQADGTVYAVWEKIGSSGEKPGINWPAIIPIPIPLPSLPLPIPLPIGNFTLPCWRCLKPCDQCTCEGRCWDPRCVKHTDDVKPGETEPPPKTGDSNTLLYSALAVLVLSGGAAVVLYRKRRDDETDE